jgi:hypothetical protein
VTQTLNHIANLVLVSLVIPNIIFGFRYFLFSPYERTREGRNLLMQKIALSSLVVVLALSVIFGPEYPGRPFVRLVAFSTITIFYWTELAQLIGVQRRFPYRRFPRRNKKEKP